MSVVLSRLLVILAVVISVGPAVWTVLSSFKSSGAIFGNPFSLPVPPTGQGYVSAIQSVNLLGYFANTAVYALVAAVVCPCLALLAAYPCARMRFRGRNVIVVAISSGLATPIVSLIVPNFYIMLKTGLIDTKGGLILFYSALFFPLAFVIVRAFLMSLPIELEEAATLDGAGYFRIIFQMIAPNARPALTTVSVLVFINVWNDFLWNLVLAASYQNQNVQVLLASFQGQFTFNVSGLLAGVTIVLAVPVLIFILGQRYAIAGLAGGAAVGKSTRTGK